jgi:hypothetical protein
MSSINYRKWDLWLNTDYFNEAKVYGGYFECLLIPSLMVPQTIEFLTERYQILRNRFINIQRPSSELTHQIMLSTDGQLCLKIYQDLDTSINIHETIENVIAQIEAISVCTDSPLACTKIRYISDTFGKILTANRKPIGRGMSFEINERGNAAQKIIKDFDYFREITDNNLKVGVRHYLTGMTLLSLEDQVPGLIDAAFMQFYQGCEALCRHEKGELEASKKYIASLGVPDSRELQIIAHQIWRVRNKYFGHGDVTYNINSNQDLQNVSRVARQVLVVRYLCRRLIDSKAPSGLYLVREMGLFSDESSGMFSGQVESLESNFRADFDGRNIKIYDELEREIETYTLR